HRLLRRSLGNRHGVPLRHYFVLHVFRGTLERAFHGAQSRCKGLKFTRFRKGLFVGSRRHVANPCPVPSPVSVPVPDPQRARARTRASELSKPIAAVNATPAAHAIGLAAVMTGGSYVG